MQLLEEGIRRIAKGVAAGFRAEAEVDFRVIFAPLINAEAETDVLADAAAAVVGEANVDRAKPPSMGSEDFSFMMEKVPGAYIQVGNGDSAGLHNPAYNFNDEATPYGAALLATVVERELARRSYRRLRDIAGWDLAHRQRVPFRRRPDPVRSTPLIARTRWDEIHLPLASCSFPASVGYLLCVRVHQRQCQEPKGCRHVPE